MGKNLTPMISVIMPVYNAEKFIIEAIESILNQTFSDFEFLIFDDCSTDNSLDIIKSFKDERIRLFTSDRNIGYLEHLNTGISLARSKYIARMDADDVSSIYRFEKQVQYLEQNSSVVLVGTSEVYIDDKGQEINKIKTYYPSHLIFTFLFFGNVFIHSSVMVKTEIIKGFRYNKRYYTAEDYFLWSTIASAQKVAIIPAQLVRYRLHSNNISVTKRKEQEQSQMKVFEFHLSKLNIFCQPTGTLNLHFLLLNYKINLKNVSLREIYKLNSWIKKLILQNNKLAIYDYDTFNSQLKGLWKNCFCYSTSFRYGLLAIPLPFLYLNREVSIKIKVRFIYNCFKTQVSYYYASN